MPISDNSPQGGGLGLLAQQAAHASAPLQIAFPSLIPSKPYCTDYLQDGIRPRTLSVALQRRHLQLNGPASFTWMVQDIDKPGAYHAHRDANLPPPNFIACNPENGHAHSAYLIGTPVARHSVARCAPLRYYAAVERGVARRLEADRYYSGLIAKNPLHRDWRTEWRRDDAYSLGDLADALFEHDMRPDPTVAATFGAGRNVTVFDELRAVAYREVRIFKARGDAFDAWHNRCLNLALGLNRQFPQGMPLSEVRSIAKSVAKWTWKHFSPETFNARQARLSKLGHAKRWGNHLAAERAKPWVAMGIGRTTYYNRKQKAGQ